MSKPYEPAFPASDKLGMSLRDYFAAQALQGILQNEKINPDTPAETCETIAKKAYRLADAMMAVRE